MPRTRSTVEAAAGQLEGGDSVAGPSRVSEWIGPKGEDSDESANVTVMDALERCIVEETERHQREVQLKKQLFELRKKHKLEMEMLEKRYQEEFDQIRPEEDQRGNNRENEPTPRQIAARKAMNTSLPKFGGEAETWPLFISSFKNTTEACGFSNNENLKRLIDSLEGRALEAVRGRLVFPESVPEIIQDLKNLFGRPGRLLKTLLEQIRKAPRPDEHQLETFIGFAMKVQQLRDHLVASDLIDHLSNPLLVEELVERLPPSYRREWVRFRRGREADPIVSVFADFLKSVSDEVAEVAEFADVAVVTKEPRGTSERAEKRVCFKCGRAGHQARNCGNGYTAELADMVDTVAVAKELRGKGENVKKRLCFKCGREGHQARNCGNGYAAGVVNLVDTAAAAKEPRGKGENVLCFKCGREGHRAKNCGNSYVVQRDDTEVDTNKRKLPTIQVACEGKEIQALVDTGSEVSLIRKDVFEELPPKPQVWFNSERILRGLGGVPQRGFKETQVPLTIDSELFEIRLIVVPVGTISAKLIIGMDFLELVKYTISNNGITITPKTTQWMYNIQEDSGSYEVPPKYKKAVEGMLKRIRQNQGGEIKECPVEMAITVNDAAIPFRHAPRRLPDASKHGFGAVLPQKKDGKMHPVMFWSKKTTEGEAKQHSYILEAKAIYLAVKSFRHYLLGIRFKLVTDCIAFKQSLQKKEVPREVAGWVMFLQDFTFSVEHRPGDKLQHVDCLSRYPNQVLLIVSEVTARIRKAQRQDVSLRAIFELLSKGPYEDFVIKGGALYKVGQGNELLVIPKSGEKEIIKEAHNNGHFSVKKTLHDIQQRYWIPHLEDKVRQVVENCIPCILVNKKSGKKEGYLHPIAKGDRPLQTLHVDHVGPMDATGKQYKYILTMVHGFSKFVWLYPTKTTNAQETIQKMENWSAIFGSPERVVSDRGAAFTSTLFAEYTKDKGIEHVVSTTGVPRGNGQAERVNKTVLAVPAKLSVDDPTKWFRWVTQVQQAVNSQVSSSTRKTPFKIMFGVEMRNKLKDGLMNLIEEELVERFEEDRQEIRLEAKEAIEKAQFEYKRQYDKKRKPEREYNVGDLVAIKRTQFVTGKKLASEFMGPYEITQVNRKGRYKVRKVAACEGPNVTATSGDHMKSWAHMTAQDDLGSSDQEI